MIDLRPLSGSVGAEVVGLDLSVDSIDDLAADLVAALHERQLLLFRGGVLDVAAQLRVSDLFGKVALPWDATHAHPDEPYVEVFRGSHAREYRRPAEHWHTDASFLAEPTDATLLHALTVPTSGGRTSFTNARAALEALPEKLRASVERLDAVHDFGSQFARLRVAAGRVTDDGSERERNDFPPVRHPIVRSHPVTGTRALYLNELCLHHIDGVTQAESEAILAQLYAHTLQDRWRYSHQWQVGDLLVWDNPSLLHRGEPVPVDQYRLVHRSTVTYRNTHL
jgi:taurine dioxygenase